MRNYYFPPKLKSTGVAIALVTITFFASALFQIALEFNNAFYDWDIDHEMYFGQALLRGELIWTAEFHDKLPLVQYFFAIPALFESVTVWRIISLVFGLSAAIVLIYLSPFLFEDSKKFRRTGWLAAGIYLNLFVLMPGSLTNINAVPTSSAIIASALLFSFFEQKNGPKKMVLLALLIAFFSTVSISFRPYFLFALVPAAVWLSANFIFRSVRYSRFTKVSLVFGLGATIAAVGFGANIFPYILTGQTGAFGEGLTFLLQQLNPNSAHESFIAQLRLSFVLWVIAAFSLLMLFLGLGWALFAILSREPGAYFFGLVSLSSWGLALGILTQHWWGHYSNLFSWYFAIIAAGLINRFFRLMSKNDDFKSIFAGVNVITASTLLIAAPIILAGFNLERATSHVNKHSETWRLDAIRSFLDHNYEESVNFLSPEHMYTHWKLGEPRHGFPHAANIGHIKRGWWEHTLATDNFLSPKSSAEFCDLLENSSVDVVFVEPNSEFTNCASATALDGDFMFRQVVTHSKHKLEVWDRLG